MSVGYFLRKSELVLVALAAGLLGGCCLTKECELQKVAKDWSQVIRASQVMPVYPLTEDVFPGDLYLVQLPIDKQQEQWNDRGYLALDNMIARLTPKGYKLFYGDSFEVPKDGRLPNHWLRPGQRRPAGGTNSTGNAGTGPSNAAGTATAAGSGTAPHEAWADAPSAAFPTYTFSVSSGAGFSGALPIYGVPVGMSLLGSNQAHGTVTLSDARTYGIDILSLYGEVLTFSRRADMKAFLSYFGAKEGDGKSKPQQNYLRVVYRVYLVGSIDVSVHASGSGSAGVDVGVPKPVDLLFDKSDGGTPPAGQLDAETRYQRNVKALNETLKAVYGTGQEMAPGASLKVAAASSRSVTLREDFPRPLVVGYLGFDLPILKNGELGAPIPTFSIANNDATDASIQAVKTAIEMFPAVSPIETEMKYDLNNAFLRHTKNGASIAIAAFDEAAKSQKNAAGQAYADYNAFKNDIDAPAAAVLQIYTTIMSKDADLLK